jgi:hypothetical protein
MRARFVRVSIIATALAACIAGGAEAAEQVYKWVGPDGTVHYGQKPPPAGNSQVIDVRAPAATSEPAAALTAEQSEAAEACRRATENFETLSTEGEIRRKDEYGEIHAMSADEVAAERERAKAAMERFCAPATPAN